MKITPPEPLPNTPDWAKAPLPLTVMLLVPLVIAPKVNLAAPPPTGFRILKMALPVRVVAPKVIPAVPPFTLPPPVIVNVWLPMERAPSV